MHLNSLINDMYDSYNYDQLKEMLPVAPTINTVTTLFAEHITNIKKLKTCLELVDTNKQTDVVCKKDMLLADKKLGNWSKLETNRFTVEPSRIQYVAYSAALDKYTAKLLMDPANGVAMRKLKDVFYGQYAVLHLVATIAYNDDLKNREKLMTINDEGENLLVSLLRSCNSHALCVTNINESIKLKKMMLFGLKTWRSL